MHFTSFLAPRITSSLSSANTSSIEPQVSGNARTVQPHSRVRSPGSDLRTCEWCPRLRYECRQGGRIINPLTSSALARGDCWSCRYSQTIALSVSTRECRYGRLSGQQHPETHAQGSGRRSKCAERPKPGKRHLIARIGLYVRTRGHPDASAHPLALRYTRGDLDEWPQLTCHTYGWRNPPLNVAGQLGAFAAIACIHEKRQHENGTLYSVMWEIKSSPATLNTPLYQMTRSVTQNPLTALTSECRSNIALKLSPSLSPDFAY